MCQHKPRFASGRTVIHLRAAVDARQHNVEIPASADYKLFTVLILGGALVLNAFGCHHKLPQH
jgi:hypothetical protein